MNVEDFVDSLISGYWTEEDSKQAVMAEVETLIAELNDDVMVKEIVTNLYEAFREEHGVG